MLQVCIFPPATDSDLEYDVQDPCGGRGWQDARVAVARNNCGFCSLALPMMSAAASSSARRRNKRASRTERSSAKGNRSQRSSASFRRAPVTCGPRSNTSGGLSQFLGFSGKDRRRKEGVEIVLRARSVMLAISVHATRRDVSRRTTRLARASARSMPRFVRHHSRWPVRNC